jgi:hypothetical protein
MAGPWKKADRERLVGQKKSAGGVGEKIDLLESDMANSTAVVTESDAVVYGHRLVAASISYWLCFK